MEIDNLELKLEGKLPVTREELFILVNSWGRKDTYLDGVHFNSIQTKECYDLSKLDTSEINNIGYLFRCSYFNGDISKWDVSHIKDMYLLFSDSQFNGDISNWNVSNVKTMKELFSYSMFNGDISKWDISNVINMTHIFSFGKFSGDISNWKFNENITLNCFVFDNKNFEKKYNDGKKLPTFSPDIKKWFEENRTNIASLNITKEELVDIDDYLSNFDLNKTNYKGIL